MKILTANNLSIIAGEPHVFDLHLAQSLGFSRLTSIRVLIERNREELETYGTLHRCDAKSSGGRPGKAYYLNEGQALVLCALSETPRAAEVRKLLIDVFMAWRQGKTVHVKEHHRRPPSETQPAPTLSFALADRGMVYLTAYVPFDTARVMANSYLMLR